MNQAFYFHRIANPNIILSFNARTFLFDCPNASKAVYEINFYSMTLFLQCYFIKLSKQWTSSNFAFHCYSKTLHCKVFGVKIVIAKVLFFLLVN